MQDGVLTRSCFLKAFGRAIELFLVIQAQRIVYWKGSFNQESCQGEI